MMASYFGKAQELQKEIDSLKKSLFSIPAEERYIQNCFLIADNFMEIDQYDSAQHWLNNIAEKLPLKKPSLSNYFLSTRQAEVYYYNGLQRLGLEESQRSYRIAAALHDSILLADACNFIGLFYINLDSCATAIPYFKAGISFAKLPPYPKEYLSLTLPHHLYGNMAEAYQKLNKPDLAVSLSRKSLLLASAIGDNRGTAAAHNNMATAFLSLKLPDSALLHYSLSEQTALQSKDADMELIDLAGIARSEDLLSNKTNALASIRKGFLLWEEKNSINNLFAGQFLDHAVYLYKKYRNNSLLSEALEKKSSLMEKQMKEGNDQINSILKASLENETRALNLDVKDARQRNEIINTRVYLLSSILILLIAAFFFYRYKANQKLSLIQLQNQISQDLHDDVGSSLSSLQVYSSVADQLMESHPQRAREMLKKISLESMSLMENIGDIVWSMKIEKEQRLDTRIKNFISDVLGAAGINYQVNVEEEAESMIRNITARRNILLIIKEAVNNAVKYSKASHVSVQIKKLAGQVCLVVADDGIGFQKPETPQKGKGLFNMQQRTDELKGLLQITSDQGKGTIITVLFHSL